MAEEKGYVKLGVCSNISESIKLDTILCIDNGEQLSYEIQTAYSKGDKKLKYRLVLPVAECSPYVLIDDEENGHKFVSKRYFPSIHSEKEKALMTMIENLERKICANFDNHPLKQEILLKAGVTKFDISKPLYYSSLFKKTLQQQPNSRNNERNWQGPSMNLEMWIGGSSSGSIEDDLICIQNDVNLLMTDENNIVYTEIWDHSNGYLESKKMDQWEEVKDLIIYDKNKNALANFTINQAVDLLGPSLLICEKGAQLQWKVNRAAIYYKRKLGIIPPWNDHMEEFEKCAAEFDEFCKEDPEFLNLVNAKNKQQLEESNEEENQLLESIKNRLEKENNLSDITSLIHKKCDRGTAIWASSFKLVFDHLFDKTRMCNNWHKRSAYLMAASDLILYYYEKDSISAIESARSIFNYALSANNIYDAEKIMMNHFQHQPNLFKKSRIDVIRAYLQQNNYYGAARMLPKKGDGDVDEYYSDLEEGFMLIFEWLLLRNCAELATKFVNERYLIQPEHYPINSSYNIHSKRKDLLYGIEKKKKEMVENDQIYLTTNGLWNNHKSPSSTMPREESSTYRPMAITGNGYFSYFASPQRSTNRHDPPVPSEYDKNGNKSTKSTNSQIHEISLSKNTGGEKEVTLLPTDDPALLKEQGTENNQCSICMERPKQAANLPCGHFIMCVHCSHECWNTRKEKDKYMNCYLCAKPVKSVVQIFNS